MMTIKGNGIGLMMVRGMRWCAWRGNGGNHEVWINANVWQKEKQVGKWMDERKNVWGHYIAPPLDC